MIRKTAFIVAGLTLTFSSAARAQEAQLAPADEMTISEIMKEAHKRPHQLLKVVSKGEASDDQKARLVALYESMAKQAPPVGEQAKWDELNSALVDAAKKVQEGVDGAERLLKKASNCVGCHKHHKPQDG